MPKAAKSGKMPKEPKDPNAYLYANDIGSQVKRLATGPSRSMNTAITKAVRGPDLFREARAKDPSKYLTDAEIANMKPMKSRQGEGFAPISSKHCE